MLVMNGLSKEKKKKNTGKTSQLFCGPKRHIMMTGGSTFDYVQTAVRHSNSVRLKLLKHLHSLRSPLTEISGYQQYPYGY